MSPIDYFILDQPEKLQPILKKLRSIIISCSPHIEEKMVYGIPFFYLHKRIFYLNPKPSFVELGFCNGFLISDHPMLESKNRTQVKTITFHHFNDVQEKSLREIVQEAILVNEFLSGKKKK